MASVPTTADVVVIGGGPAGATAAAMLAKEGIEVVILERSHHPRPTVGESLIPDFWKYTDTSGATASVVAEGFVKKGGALISWNGRNLAHSFDDFGYERPAMHVERDLFDEILFKNAIASGASAFEDVNVRGAAFWADESGRDWVTVEYLIGGDPGEIVCRYVIDASGQAAILGRQTDSRTLDEAFRYLGLWGYFLGSRYLSLEGVAHDESEMDVVRPVTFLSSLDGSGDNGWSWHIRLRESTSVGLVLPLDVTRDAREPGETWEAYFERRVRSTPVLKDLLDNSSLIPGSVSTIRDYSHQSSQVAGPGWFLVGDAAGFVDPIFSVGVVLAMFGAATAAWAVGRSLAHPEKAEHVRSLFSAQLQGRIQVARSLALPRYHADDEMNELAREVYRLERQVSKDIMYVVAESTTRSDNWRGVVGEDVSALGSDKMRVIDEIQI